MFQKPRSADEDATFHHALTHMDLLYAHQLTVVWKMTRRLPGYEHVPAYGARGWPFFESCACGLVKRPGNLYDLGNVDFTQPVPRPDEDDSSLGSYVSDRYKAQAAAGLRYHGVLKPALELAAQSTHESCVSTGFEVLLAPTGTRVPPMLPAAFAREVATKVFTNAADTATVTKMYSGLTHSVLVGATELNFGGQGWGAAEANVLAAMLPLCPVLASLRLRMNRFGADGFASLFGALRGNQSLTYLEVDSCGMGDDGAASLAALLAADDCALQHIVTDCNGIGADGSTAIATALKANRTLTKLEMGDNSRIGARIDAFAPVLASNSTLTALQLNWIWSEDREAGAAAKKALEDANAARRSPAELSLLPDSLEDD